MAHLMPRRTGPLGDPERHQSRDGAAGGAFRLVGFAGAAVSRRGGDWADGGEEDGFLC